MIECKSFDYGDRAKGRLRDFVESETQALSNAAIAREAHCDGIFLINHEVSAETLLEIHSRAVAELPDWWIGVNCLGYSLVEVFQTISDEVQGVWVDNAGIDERTPDQTEAEEILSERQRHGWRGLYFGGVAFKYQRPVEDLERAASVAAKYMDVVTTSGPGTGKAATQDKIRAMKRELSDTPLAIASGVTPENVVDYLDFADAFLVATGISRSWSHLDPVLVNALVQTIRNWEE